MFIELEVEGHARMHRWMERWKTMPLVAHRMCSGNNSWTLCFAHYVNGLIPSVLWRCWLGDRKGIRPVKNWVVGCWHGCLERGADLHMAQLMPLPLTVSCFSKIQTGFTFLVPAHLGSSGKRAVKRVCKRVYGLKTVQCDISDNTLPLHQTSIYLSHVSAEKCKKKKENIEDWLNHNISNFTKACQHHQ